MAQEQAETRYIPPYVPYKTFRTFIDGLRVAMPSRIDRSLMGTMSGATQGQLISALRFLDLITENGTPTGKLKDLATLDGEERQHALQKVIGDAYDDRVFPESVDLQNGTYRQLQEAFAATGAQGDTVRKCIAFWLLASRDADLIVSPHFTLRGSRGPIPKRRKTIPQRIQRTQAPATAEEESERAIPRSRLEILMEKFPSFDPSWEAEVQEKWFTAFERLQDMTRADGDG
jgi:hypothetical protein